MFLFHDLKIIYIIVPATGSNSFHKTMCPKHDHTQIVVKKDHPAFNIHNIRMYQHFTAEQARECIEPKIWNSYEKIAFVRHPWDWVTSMYRKNGVDVVGIDNSGTFFDFVNNLERTPYFWFTDKDGHMLIDTIYRTEDLKQLSEKWGFEYKHINKSVRKKAIVRSLEIEHILAKKFEREYRHYD